MQISLRHSLFRILLGGIVITATLILVSVWNGTASLVQNSLDKEIDVAKEIFKYRLEAQASKIGQIGYISSRQYSVISAVIRGQANDDIATTESYLDSLILRTDADWTAYLGLNGDVVASSPKEQWIGEQLPENGKALLTDSDNYESGFLILSDSLYHVVASPVKMPITIAYTMFGYEINDQYLASISNIMQAEVIVHSTTDVTAERLAIASSVEPAVAQYILQTGSERLNWLDFLTGGKESYVSRQVDMSDIGLDGLPVEITIALDVTKQYQGFANLLFSIVVISVVASAVSLMVVMLLSHRVSRPVSRLVEAVDSIADGNYEQTLPDSGNLKEISDLSHAFSSMQSNLKSREERIRFQAQHDMLTGLYNRNYVEEHIGARLQSRESFQVIAISVNGFRTINDLYGYVNGDKVLQVTAQRLARWPGMAARLAGGEILYISETALNELQLETLRHILEQSVEVGLVAIPVKVSLVLLDCPADAESAEDLFRKINIVKDEANRSGSWLVQYDDDLEKHYLRRLAIITELKRSLQSDRPELSMVYQPKLALDTMTVTSMEALVRWNSEALGFVPPDEFIGIAEQAGLIEQVTTWVMGQTISDLSRFRAKGHTFSIAMNLSSHDIQNTALLDRLILMLEEADLTPQDLELEITESDLVEDADLAIENMRKLKASGFRFAIDDFGTGYSSLAYLKHLPVTTIKIDKSFILNLAKDENDQQIVHTVLSLAHIFDLDVVAEGVEDEVSLVMLQEWGCDIAQGYFISKPQSAEVLFDWLEVTPYQNKKER
ncbi:sensor domain-containing phosphodiesterase [Alteromonas antoniana]|uniref:sensor domain-containing phosphodiesterase n=1 Tax=Alteromonas antoniana TaxID=2803813 RepID=UPI001C476A4A|nr:sensor domain-containing phosphodiesterase [Alteromonas antoniana]